MITYDHTNGEFGQVGTCVIGGDFYRTNLYPVAYQGSYFYADYSGNWIHRAILDSSGNLISNTTFASNIPGPTCVEQARTACCTMSRLPQERYGGSVMQPRRSRSATPAFGIPRSSSRFPAQVRRLHRRFPVILLEVRGRDDIHKR